MSAAAKKEPARPMLSFRVPRALKERLERRAAALNRDRTSVATEALEVFLDEGEPRPPTVVDGQVDPARWLADRTGESVGRCRVLIAVGKVELGGRRVAAELIDRADLEMGAAGGEVVVDGRVV
jgi:predicted transcriptional regulator